MSVVAHCIGIEKTGIPVTVPNDPLARIMYYLNCIQSITTLDFGVLSDYKNYTYITSYQKDLILEAAKILNPVLLVKLNLFLVFNSQETNEFWKINDQRLIHCNINRTLSIGQFTGNVTQIMSAPQSWFDRNYYQPLNDLQYTYNYARTSTAYNYNCYPTYRYTPSTKNHFGWLKSIFILCLILFSIIGFIYLMIFKGPIWVVQSTVHTLKSTYKKITGTCWRIMKYVAKFWEYLVSIFTILKKMLFSLYQKLIFKFKHYRIYG